MIYRLENKEVREVVEKMKEAGEKGIHKVNFGNEKIEKKILFTHKFGEGESVTFTKNAIFVEKEYEVEKLDYNHLFNLLSIDFRKKRPKLEEKKIEKLNWLGKIFPQHDYVVDGLVRILVELKQKQDELIDYINKGE